jgi:LPS-assembly protein
VHKTFQRGTDIILHVVPSQARKTRLRRLLLPLLLSLSCASGPAAVAAAGGEVTDWGGCPVEPPSLPPPAPDVADEQLEVLSGRAEFQIGGNATFTDAIRLRSGNRLLSADGATFDSATGIFAVTGAVEFRDPQTLVSASAASYDSIARELRFESADFQLWSVPARGAAEDIKVTAAGKLRLNAVSYTSCPKGTDDWMLKAKRIRIDQGTGVGTARDARLEFKGVPILYFPYISYPVTNQRKSGWLIPDLGTSDQRGLDLEFPYYWNIAPNYDATLAPRYMSKRGVQLKAEGRYLRQKHDGVLTGEYLNDDDETGKDRSLLAWFHQSQLWAGWRGTIDAINVSDSSYFEDFSSSLAATSQTHLSRRLDFEFYNHRWSALLRVQDYQTIDDTITGEDKPYKRLPQLAVRGYEPRGVLGLSYGVEADVTYFDRNLGVTGLRAHLMPEVALPLNLRFLDIEPSVALNYTFYELSDTQPGEPDSPDRTAPVYSVDMGTTFERLTNRKRWIQTLEPRLLYAYIPFENQDDLPVFDTIEPDLNVVQLFRTNRFAGYDRLGDTNQLSLGITSRLLAAGQGKEFLRATIGQIYYFDDRDVTLPGGEPSDDNNSDWLAELDMNLYDSWRVRLGYQYDADDNKTGKAEARVQYRPDIARLASVAYRFRRDALEEIDVSLAWPLGDRWNAVGRYNYSIEDREPLERFVGIEYETCCWGVRAVWRRHLTRRTGESDTSINVQLVLKGFSSVGKPAERLLDRGILDYDIY